MKVDAHLSIVASEAKVGFNEDEAEGAVDDTVGKGDSDLAMNHSLERIRDFGLELRDGGLGSLCERRARLFRRSHVVDDGVAVACCDHGTFEIERSRNGMATVVNARMGS
jgi:hypothetical protein